MNGQSTLGWVCQNQDWIGPLLAIVFPASVASAWADKMPAPVAHFVNALGLNWGDIARAIAAALTKPPAVLPKP